MWHEPTFDPATIDKELGWAAGIGMNTMRVFLHNLLWENDPEGLKKRMNEFLAIADKHKIKIMFVLFDSVWDPNPVYGLQSRSEEHTSELQSLMRISYDVFCLKKKKQLN